MRMPLRRPHTGEATATVEAGIPTNLIPWLLPRLTLRAYLYTIFAPALDVLSMLLGQQVLCAIQFSEVTSAYYSTPSPSSTATLAIVGALFPTALDIVLFVIRYPPKPQDIRGTGTSPIVVSVKIKPWQQILWNACRISGAAVGAIICQPTSTSHDDFLGPKHALLVALVGRVLMLSLCYPVQALASYVAEVNNSEGAGGRYDGNRVRKTEA